MVDPLSLKMKPRDGLLYLVLSGFRDEQASILRMMLKSDTNIPEQVIINLDGDKTLTETYMKPEDFREIVESTSKEESVTFEALEELFNGSPKSQEIKGLFNSPKSRENSQSTDLNSPQILSAQSSEEMDVDFGQLDEIFSQAPSNLPYEKRRGYSSSYEETQSEVQKPNLRRNDTRYLDAGKGIWGKKDVGPRREPLLMTQTRPEENVKPKNDFITARKELQVQNLINYGKDRSSVPGGQRRVGLRKPLTPKSDPPEEASKKNEKTSDDELCEQLSHIDPKIIEMIKNEIMMKIAVLHWKDIIGLTFAKKIIQEAIVLPMLRPDIFTGIRRPPRGILLFGPPGTGKTLIGKCIASQAKATFFNISASTLTSKYIGEGEKMVRGLFAVASAQQPSVIFIDEVDSLLCQRSENEHESSRRLKTEFLIHLDGAATNENEIVLVVGATNRPQELDEAVRRRFVKRLYIPLPIKEARLEMVKSLFAKVTHNLSEQEMASVSQMTEGFSGADMKSLCQEASMGPIRSIPMDKFQDFSNSDLRPVIYEDFQTAMQCVRASVSPEDIESYLKWDKVYGSGGKGM